VVGVVGLEEAMMAMATLGFPEAGLPFRPASRLVPVPADWDTRRRKLPCLVSHSDIHCSVRPPNDDPWKRKEAHITPPAFLSKTKQKHHAIHNLTRSAA